MRMRWILTGAGVLAAAWLALWAAVVVADERRPYRRVAGVPRDA
jgi:hypothetical protein